MKGCMLDVVDNCVGNVSSRAMSVCSNERMDHLHEPVGTH